MQCMQKKTTQLSFFCVHKMLLRNQYGPDTHWHAYAKVIVFLSRFVCMFWWVKDLFPSFSRHSFVWTIYYYYPLSIHWMLNNTRVKLLKSSLNCDVHHLRAQIHTHKIETNEERNQEKIKKNKKKTRTNRSESSRAEPSLLKMLSTLPFEKTETFNTCSSYTSTRIHSALFGERVCCTAHT